MRKAPKRCYVLSHPPNCTPEQLGAATQLLVPLLPLKARLVKGSPILSGFPDEISVAQITAWLTTEKARVEEVIKLATGKLKGVSLVVLTKVNTWTHGNRSSVKLY